MLLTLNKILYIEEMEVNCTILNYIYAHYTKNESH